MGSNEEVYYYGKHPFLNRFKFPLLIIVGIMASLAWVIFSTSTSTLSPTASETDNTNIIAEPAENANPDAVLDPNAIAPEVAPVEEVQPAAPAPVPVEEPAPFVEQPIENIPAQEAPVQNTEPSPTFTYASCKEVRAAKANPIRPGDYGWQNDLDGYDNDNIGCE
jgi:type IV secretory pathway VirB10-like protein